MGEGENHLQFFLTAQTSGGILLSVSTASGSDRLLVNSWSRPLSVFRRSDKRLDHFCIDEVAVELIQLRQPEFLSIGCLRQVLLKKRLSAQTEPSVIRPTARGRPSRSYQVIHENSAERFRLISFGIFIAD